MDTNLRRAHARHFKTLALLPAALLCAAAAANAEPAPPSGADSPLGLARAEQLALERQPLLEARRAGVRAGRKRAVAAGQLPDPMLVAGVQNLPVTGEDRYDLGAEMMTMVGVGLMQEVPLPAKRRLRGKAESLMADAGEAQLAALERAVRRDAAMAWLAAWFPQRAGELAQALAGEAERERAAAEIAFRAGRAPQSEVLAAEVETELLRDRVHKLAQDAAEAREKLARWTGLPAGALAAEIPGLPPPPALDVLLAALPRHPELAQAGLEVAAAGNAVALERENYWPDWRVEAMYGWREAYDEMLTVQVGVDLPVFTGRRQDRNAAAARESLAASEALREDRARELRAAAAAAWHAWSEASARLVRYDEAIVPRSRARAEAALAAYRAGKADLMAVIGARRAALDAELMRLELQMEVLSRRFELRYLDMVEN